MSIDVSASVVDGQVVASSTPTNTSSSTVGSDSLGKDAFLQLLVTQMQYQNPLEPSADTEYISQLAQFSSLEEMQNLNDTFSNNTAYGLVGKNVIIASGSSKGEEPTYVAGNVQYVQMVEGKAFLAINETLYSVDDLDSIISDEYLSSINKNSNTVTE